MRQSFGKNENSGTESNGQADQELIFYRSLIAKSEGIKEARNIFRQTLERFLSLEAVAHDEARKIKDELDVLKIDLSDPSKNSEFNQKLKELDTLMKKSDVYIEIMEQISLEVEKLEKRFESIEAASTEKPERN
ncbi:MAG TPA: hypothetical protein VJI33_00245 [Candidatus Paceibacterota bacterium]